MELECPGKVHLALETNGRGWLGYVEELPGAFVRGQTQADCHAKADGEIRRYLGWLGCPTASELDVSVVQVIQSDLCVEDADNCILIESDKRGLQAKQFESWSEIALYSALCFQRLYGSASHRTWRDPARIRSTFLSKCPASINDIHEHVDQVQAYYLQCLKRDHTLAGSTFVERRGECLSRISRLYEEDHAASFDVGHEQWTIAKALRRYIWHDRIHAKSIVRTLQRLQIDPGTLDDPFGLGQLDTTVRTDLINE